MGLTQVNARAFVFVLERLHASGKGSIHLFGEPDRPATSPVAICRLQPEGAGHAVFTLASGTRIYVTMTEAEPQPIAAILARLERERFGGEAAEAVGAVDDPFMQRHGRAGVALIAPSACRFHAGLPDVVQIGTSMFPISIVHFLSADELAFAELSGVAVLRERFRLCGRNLLRFAATPAR